MPAIATENKYFLFEHLFEIDKERHNERGEEKREGEIDDMHVRAMTFKTKVKGRDFKC